MKFKWGFLSIIAVFLVISLISSIDNTNEEVVTRVSQSVYQTENFLQESVANKEVVVESLSVEKTVIEKKKTSSCIK